MLFIPTLAVYLLSKNVKWKILPVYLKISLVPVAAGRFPGKRSKGKHVPLSPSLLKFVAEGLPDVNVFVFYIPQQIFFISIFIFSCMGKVLKPYYEAILSQTK